MNRRYAVGLSCGALALAVVVALGPSSSTAESPAKAPAANAPSANTPAANTSVEQARREVLLLDDIYKSAIVLITKNYVTEKSDLAAGTAFKLLFQSMKDKGWHEVRLLDGLGEPLNDKDRPQDDFEKKAVKEIMAGKSGYEEVVKKEGKEFLRSATPVPMVMDKCILCHENYRGKKVVGALSYTLPLDVKPATK